MQFHVCQYRKIFEFLDFRLRRFTYLEFLFIGSWGGTCPAQFSIPCNASVYILYIRFMFRRPIRIGSFCFPSQKNCALSPLTQLLGDIACRLHIPLYIQIRMIEAVSAKLAYTLRLPNNWVGPNFLVSKSVRLVFYTVSLLSDGGTDCGCCLGFYI